MAVHLQDEQEIDNFKYFWRRYGRWIFAVLMIAALAYLGWVVYRGYMQRDAEKAGAVFEVFVADAQGGKNEEAKKQLLILQQQYGKTLPATQATLMMAGTAFDAGRYDEAAGHLQWVEKKQKDDLIRTIVAQRLAAVYLQQKKYDAAMKAADIRVADEFKPVLMDTRADILLAQNKKKEALAVYQEVLKLLPEDAPQRPIIRMKAEALG